MPFAVSQIPVWTDNYAYLLTTPDGQTALVDSPEAGPIVQALEAGDLQLTHIFCTHHHPDHIGANAELAERFPDLEIWGSRYDLEQQRIPGQTRGWEDEDSFEWGGETCTVRDVAAHTLGHIAYSWSNGTAFVGDTIFFGGCGRLFEGTAEQMDHALYEVIGRLPADTLLYCAHEYTEANLRFAATVDPHNKRLRELQEEVAEIRSQGRSTVPSQLQLEREVNPFLRCDEPAIREAVGATDTTPRHEVLGALRTMKDRFRG
ncbi:MAG: hydroxyacylglutathione hydrolase [Myxococcota bacterium]|nr:hydroxyacylglutathione hydrolase [Myxococcota bacterium]